MGYISWGDVQTAGYQYGTLFGNAVKKVQSGVCDLYRRYPSWSTAGTLPGSPAEMASRGFYDSVCGKDPGGLPPPPTPPFSGGQCDCLLYNVTFERRNYSSSGAVTVNTSTAMNVPGKIRGIEKVVLSTGNVSYRILAGSPACPYNGFVVSNTSPSSDCFIKTVVRSNGASDVCGNPPVDWNPLSKGSPPSSETTKTEPISDSGGNTFPIVVIYAPITPTLNVNVDVGGINFKLDLGGVEINPEININGTVEPGQPPATSNPDLSEEVEQLKELLEENAQKQLEQNEDLDQIKEDLEELKREQEKQKQPEVDEENKEEPPEEKEENEEDRDDLVAVRIILTERPNKGTVQSGGAAPDWMAAGWFEWKLKPGSYHPRSPIHFDDNIYYVIPGVITVGYAFTLTNGAKARVILYKKSEIDG